MSKIIFISGLFLILIVNSCSIKKIKVDYPETVKVDTIDNYFGFEVQDRYRWLEDDNSEETAWVKAQNEITKNYLDQIPYKEQIKNRLTELWVYEKYSAPRKVSEYYIFSKSDGLQEHSMIYIQDGLDA